MNKISNGTLVKATPAPRSEWNRYTDGNWHLVRDEPDHLTGDFGRENEARAHSGRQWARAHGYRLEYRQVRGGRELYVRMLPRDTPREPAWRRYEHRATGTVA